MTILKSEPFKIEHDGMIARIIAVSEGNVGVAVLAGRLAAEGIDPGDLSNRARPARARVGTARTRKAESLDDWFHSHELERSSCQAAVAFPKHGDDKDSWAALEDDLEPLAAALDVDLIFVEK